MTAHGHAIEGHKIPPFPGLWETVEEWANRYTPREKTFIFVLTLTTLLGVGLVVYGFHEALQTLKTTNLPEYWTVKPF